MTTRTFVAWVEPIAARLAETRAEIAPLVQQVPADAWSKESHYPGWTFKDQLSHLACGHWVVQSVLDSIVAGQDPDMSLLEQIDAINEDQRLEWLDSSLEQLVAAAIAEGEETQELLARLSEDQADVEVGPFKLRTALHQFIGHDVEHLDQLRKALP